MTPLIPAVRPEPVPDDAVPFVAWSGRSDIHTYVPRFVVVYGPTGERLTAGPADPVGIPVPPDPRTYNGMTETQVRGCAKLSDDMPRSTDLRYKIDACRAKVAQWDGK